ncbi:MAG: phosphate ABC transporter permease PstA, partial [Acidimicrobiales bacterium]
MSIATLKQAAQRRALPQPEDSLRRRRPTSLHRADVALLVASAASAVSLVWFVFYQLTLFSGAAGFVIASIAVFLMMYYFANRQVFGKMVAADRVVASLVTLGSVGVVTALALVIGFLYTRGHRLISWHFFTQDQHAVTQTAPASAGGISHAIVGTLEQVGLAVVIGAPAGVATAVFLNEVGGRITAAIRTVITAMSAVPSIVAGLFIYVLLITEFNYGFRGFAGSLALAVLLLPNITRTTEEVLKVVHGSLREASMALGAPEWRTVWSVVLPTARTGIATAVLLGIARIVGETAPLLVTVSSSAYMNVNPFKDPQEALPTFVWQFYQLPLAKDVERAFAAGLVLVGLVLSLFVLARLVASIRPGAVHRMVTRL